MTIVEYQGQLEHRERKRKKRAKEEHRIEKRAQVEEDRLMGRSKGSKINMTSYKHFPSFNDQARPVFVPTETGNKSNSTEDDFPNLSPPSFAQMIRCGQKKMETQIASGSMPSYSQKSADAKSSKNYETKGSRNNDDASDDEYEEAERVPDYSTAFSDAFAKALEQATKKSPSQEDNDNGQRRKKGKKKKAIVLLSSGGR
ncbi:RING finger protein 10 [Armadillidium nasatum]|uniref:RING finger protein 10 n=1 Tax=Armadillidium nasatum TaxID=96803 RepID=A0A5N5TAF4_9CRUS|nr:RING finger protein 10 [Armadillidium nasatum]